MTDEKKGYHIAVDIDDVKVFIDALASFFGGVLDKTASLKAKLAAGEPVNIKDICGEKAATDDNKVADTPASAEESWQRRFADVDAPLGILGAIMAFKKQTGCNMCTHEIESFAEAYFQKCSKTFAAWLSDLPTDPQARRDYLASRCWEKR